MHALILCFVLHSLACKGYSSSILFISNSSVLIVSDAHIVEYAQRYHLKGSFSVCNPPVKMLELFVLFQVNSKVKFIALQPTQFHIKVWEVISLPHSRQEKEIVSIMSKASSHWWRLIFCELKPQDSCIKLYTIILIGHKVTLPKTPPKCIVAL